MGDFNCPYPNDREQIENLFIKYGMIQHVHKTSHIHGGTLDLCFSNNNIAKIALYPMWFSYHSLLCERKAT